MNTNKVLSLMIKPSSSTCNLKCDYCFYLDESFNRESPNRGFMSYDTMENIIKKAFEMDCRVSFIFQGGEPSLIGLAWFEKFIEMESLYKKDDSIIEHFFQTNGTNIDEKWAKFFKDNNFLVGVSYDGHNRIHDIHRTQVNGKKSSRLVNKGLANLKTEGVEYNILSVVTNEVAENIDIVYQGLLDKEAYFQQFIACLDPILESNENKYLDPVVYGKFLIRLFDLWTRSLDDGYNVSIRLFNNFISILMGYPPEACDMMGNCSIQYVIEADGDVYPCDFFCLDSYKLGNINTESYSDFDKQRTEIKFVEKSLIKPDECIECKYFNLCRGGCPRYASKETNKFRFCESYKMLFDARLDQFEKIAKNIMAHNSK